LTVLILLIIIVPVSKISLLQSVNEQTSESNVGTSDDNNKTFGDLNRTGFTDVTDLMINDKTYPIKYNINGGKL
jgi:hypothetical protein